MTVTAAHVMLYNASSLVQEENKNNNKKEKLKNK